MKASPLARAAHQLVELALPLIITPQLRAWLVEQRRSGTPRARIIGELVERGIPGALAKQALEYHEREFPAHLLSPTSNPRHATKGDMVLRLRRELEATSPRQIERRETPDARTFYEQYYRANRPVVMTDFADGWPALETWQLEHLRARLGPKRVLVTRGRDADPTCDVNFEELTEETSLADFIDRIIALDGAPSNDLYMIANNRNAEDPETLAALLEDVAPPEGFLDPSRHRGATSWWIGPAGTITPMHHDTSNIIFCQIVGSKRFTMVSPLHTEMLADTHHTFYSALRPAQLEARGIPHQVIDLSPGDALFIPVGWWHEVEALEPSVNISFLNFTRTNQFSWYRPARA